MVLCGKRVMPGFFQRAFGLTFDRDDYGREVYWKYFAILCADPSKSASVLPVAYPAYRTIQ
jgi:hypothetical protein